MRNLAIAASFALLAACGGEREAAPEPAATEAAAPAPAETPGPGVYDVTNPDGTKGVTTLNADGTYVDVDADGKEQAKGSYAVKDGKTCFTPEGSAEECYSESARAADGSFTATDAKGAVTQVKPQAN